MKLVVFCRLKQRGQVADMNTIIDAVNQDWSTLVSRMKLQDDELRDSVHSALGALIKQRKVYYTGNKGYFLVCPSGNTVNGASEDQRSNGNGCINGASLLFGNGTSNGAGKLTTSAIGSKFSHLRHSMRERSSANGSFNSNHSPGKNVARLYTFISFMK